MGEFGLVRPGWAGVAARCGATALFAGAYGGRGSGVADRVTVFVQSADAVLQAGIAAQLRGRPSIEVTGDLDEANVAIVVGDELDDDTLRVVRAVTRQGPTRVVVVATRLDDAALLAGVEAGATAFLRRSEATPDRLDQVVRLAAAGDGSVPADLIGHLLGQVSRLQHNVLGPRGLTLSGFSAREIDVLRLVSEGFDTAEIARRLCYSERTVKGTIHEVTSRFQLKNRAQAVAYAVRQGLI